MALAEVAQAQLLSGIFAEALKEHAPRSVAVLGCAGGNGFTEIDPTITPRVVGVDINPDYIAQARARFQDRIPALELCVGDIQAEDLVREPVDVIYAALVFEYVDAGAALDRIRSILNPGGSCILSSAMSLAGWPSIFAKLGWSVEFFCAGVIPSIHDGAPAACGWCAPSVGA